MKKDVFNLTTPQKNIWNFDQYYKGIPINNICGSVTIKENVDLTLLAQAINKFIENNDSFKLRIKLINGFPYQYFIDNKTYNFECVDFHNVEDLNFYAQKMVNTPFEILESQLFDFKLFKLPNGFGGFIINAHHIISDAATFGIVGTEVVSNYSKLKNSEDITLKDLSYSNFIESESEYFSSSRFEKDKKYWNDLYKDLPEIATIPSFKSDEVSTSASRLEFKFDKALFSKINDFCRANKISVYNFLIAIYSIYIGKINNTNNFTLGTPILNRSNFAQRHTSGMFISTSLLKINTENNPSFINFVENVATNSLAMLKHQKYDYQFILDDLRKKHKDIPNLYDITLSYQVTKATDSTCSIKYDSTWYLTPYINNSLNIHFHDNNDTGSLLIEYDYKTCKYDEQDISNIHNRILYIIEQILNNPNINLDNIEITTSEEKNIILNEFNNTSVKFPKEKNLLNLFEETVRKNPNNIAVIFEDKKITYKQLNEKANSLANCLIAKNVQANDVVCICLNRSIELIVSIFAVIKSGASYVLIDSDLPKERITYIINDCNAKYSIINNLTTDLINIQKSINIDNFDFSKYDIKNISNKNYTDNLCIIYTSGSTGNPKGVILHKHGFANLVLAFDKAINISKYKSFLGLASVSFDMFVFTLYNCVLFGNTFVLTNENEQKNPIDIGKIIKKHNVEFLVSTPSIVTLLLGKDNLKNIKGFVLGGESVSLSFYKKLRAETNAKIYNGYGPTEITACCTLKLLTSCEDITIGKPIANVMSYICDKNMNLLPVGVIGEICIAGKGVSNGYLNNENAMSLCFIKNPFGDGYIYKTGDLGRFNSDGEIEYIGRLDNQVKIRGLRIELEEIENKINSLPYINSCVVIVRENVDAHKYLCAYYVADNKIDSADIRKYLEKILPRYMVPNYFIQMDNFPHTSNGKIDKKILPEPEYIHKKNIISPRNDIDFKLLELLKNLLNIDNISIDDNFLELGGDSLFAINLGVHIQEQFNVQILVKDILNYPTIQDLSDIIAKNKNSNIVEKSVITPVSKKDYYDVSYAQKRIYFSCQVAGKESVLYNAPGGIILDGLVDKEKLENCLKKLVERHESFRTCFDIVDEEVVQKISDKLDYKLDIVENADFNNIDNIFKKFVKPFDLSKAPLFRTQFVSFTNGQSALFFDIHHIISDGTSMTFFIDELCKLYNDETLPNINITYKDFSTFENNLIKSDGLKESENYWLEQFKGEIPILNMPTSFPRPAVQSFEGKKVYSIIDTNQTEKINQISKNLGITPYMLLLSCYYILLSKYTKQDDIIIGSPIINRDLIGHNYLIGMFANTLALRNKVDNNITFRDFLLQIKENMLLAYKNQSYPFDKLVNKLNIKRDISRQPLFDTMFTYQNNGFPNIKLKNINSEYYIPDSNISKFDLSVEAIPIDDKINLSFEYATKLFEEEFINNLSIHYLNILNAVLDNIDTKILDIDYLSKEEQNKILYEFNDTEVPYDENKTIVSLFEEQAKKTPDNIAIVFNDKKLTYKQLNEKANSLAYYLRNTKKVKRNDLVGIMVNRSLEMIISILAVLKSGGAYFPIDPTFPKDRIDYMLNNSNAILLLTQEHLENRVNFKNVLLVDLNKNSIYEKNSENLKNINKPDDLSYVIFTSGSTGKPKGVMLKHKALSNLTNYCNNHVEYLKTEEYKAIVSITTVSFDIFIFETLISLQKGLKLVIANENEQNTPHLLNKLIEKYDIKIIQTTPSRIQLFVNNIDNIPALKNLEYITLAGEQLPLDLVESLKSLSNPVIYNGYGPSETTVFSTLTKIDTNKITIGRPLNNTQIYILDENLKPVPIGVSGEIYISGDGVGKGYLNNEDLTNKSFIQNPFIPNTIMYKTGDIGMYNKNGEISCLGRLDNQVKIRGLRIELDEIESLIKKYPNIKETVVVKQNINNREFISAYYTTTKRINISELRKYLSKSLPRYMVPSYYIVLNEFLYTPNGKINKKALPIPIEILNISKEKYVAPKTIIQKKLVHIWEKLLNTKPIGINDNFFELGGDSLLAMNLNIELLKISNKVTYQDIFRFPTISELEELINSNESKPFFSKIQNLSENFIDILNNSVKRKRINKYHPRNILLTGATGFLGIHILQEFLKREPGKIYCIVKDDPGITAKTKLYQKLNYYFGNKYDKLIDKRIIVLTGNITEPAFDLNQDNLLELANSVDVVINSAANVSHYGNYNDFYNTNVKSVKNIIDFCKSFNKKLYHISTTSVSGTKLDTSFPMLNKQDIIKFDESSLYVGQNLDNVYIHSKFEAESLILDAISKRLDGYILRMGNLMPRYKDGVFQENISSNAFINRIISFIKIGTIPDYILDEPIELTPVDYAAKAIYKIITNSNNTNRIFHLYNHKLINTSKIVNIAKRYNFNIEVLSEELFKEKINNILKSEKSNDLLANLSKDFDNDLHLDYKNDIILTSNFTIRYLRKTFFRWPKISNRYLIKFIKMIRREI